MTLLSKTDEIQAKLLDITIDWDGSSIPDGAEPRTVPSCADLRQAHALIEEYKAEVERKDAALQAYLTAYKAGTGTVYVEPIIRAREVLAVEKAVERLREAGKELCAAIDRARNLVPDDEEGLAAQVFCHHINAAQMNYYRTALEGTSNGD